MVTAPPESLLTISKVREWKVERDIVAAKVAVLSETLTELDGKLQAVSEMFPDLDVEKIAAPVTAKALALENPKTWPDLVLSILSKATGPQTMHSLKASIAETEFAERLARNANGFYNAVSRLTSRGEIERVGDTFYSLDFRERVEAGGIGISALEMAQDTRKPTTPELVLETLTGQGYLTPKQIVDRLKGNEDFDEKIARNPQYLYTVLGRMVARNGVVKNNGKYATPSEAAAMEREEKTDEATGVGTANSPMLFPQPSGSRH
ncbi:hypothetical protein [Sphingomonas sp. R86521]|uniref:hypothetical protein n=1 Tax=Sphingomonas sp. R86521 TaxID=3093860 RepID=UPI0036D28EC3